MVAVPRRRGVVAEVLRYHPTPTSAPPIHRILRREELQSLGYPTVTREKIIKVARLNTKRLQFLRIGMDAPW